MDDHAPTHATHSTDLHQTPAPVPQAHAAYVPESGMGELLELQRAAGNQAVGQILHGGQPLDPATRATMESRFGHDFGQVRVYQDAQTTQAIGALAFTRGQDIVFGEGQYRPGTPEGDHLLAHELAHVVQQSRASALIDAISSPSDVSEQSAETAADAGKVATGSVVPTVQRQTGRQTETPPVTRTQAQTALADFFRRVIVAQGGTDRLRGTAQVWNGIHDLFGSDAMRSASIDTWLTRPDPSETSATPGSHRSSPDQFAHNIEASVVPATADGLASEVARYLPETIDPAFVARLNARRAVQEPLTLPARVGGLIGRTAPGGPEDRNEPRQPTAEERAEQIAGDIRRLRGLPDPTTVGPVSVDVLRLGRILRGLPGAVRTPRTTTPVQARSYPAVDQVIADIARNQADVLIPQAARGTPQADNYASAADFAGNVARELDIAQTRKTTQVTFELGASYADVRDRGPIYQAVRDIVYRIRDALPHHASEVNQIYITVNGRPSFGFPVRPSSQ